MKRGKLYTILFIFGVLIIGTKFSVAQITNPAYLNNPEIDNLNQEIEESENKIDNLKKATEEYQDKIEEYQNKEVTLKNQLSLLDNQIIKLELDIKTTQLQIDKKKLEIEAMNFQVDKEQKEIELQKENLKEYIKLIDKSDQRSYLEILILNDSFAEFFNEVNYLEEVQNNVKGTVDRLQLLKTTIETQKADAERQKEELEKLKSKIEEQNEKLKYENKSMEVLLVETKSSEIQFQKLLLEAKQRQNEIDSHILNLKDKIQDKIRNLSGGSSSPKTTLVSWPIPGPHVITAYFHDPDYPYRYVFEHPAIDIRAAQGTPITAPADAYVSRAVDAGYGYSYIILIHDNGISTVYGHVSKIYVSADSYVKAGDIIGLTGGTPGTPGAGNLTSGPHLHFETRLNGIPVNPLEYLP